MFVPEVPTTGGVPPEPTAVEDTVDDETGPVSRWGFDGSVGLAGSSEAGRSCSSSSSSPGEAEAGSCVLG